MKVLYVRNWRRFQHYAERRPPWIKLHRELIDDFEFAALPLASKALAPLVWLLASETAGSIVHDADRIAFRLHWKVPEVEGGLKGLIDNGFLSVDSAVLAECLQDACLETETETEGETETEAEGRASARKRRASRTPKPIFTPPTVEQVADYAKQIGAVLTNPKEFLAYWTEESWINSKGRRVLDWKKTFRNRERALGTSTIPGLSRQPAHLAGNTPERYRRPVVPIGAPEGTGGRK